jgi:hypothetical protein
MNIGPEVNWDGCDTCPMYANPALYQYRKSLAKDTEPTRSMETRCQNNRVIRHEFGRVNELSDAE